MRKIINQSDAARIRGVSRQRISELYGKGRFTIPVDDAGVAIKGAIYLDEIETLTDAKRGRPPLTDEQKLLRGLDTYHAGDEVSWQHKPRDGYGYSININAKVIRVGASKLLLEFKNAEDAVQTAWVNRNFIEG